MPDIVLGLVENRQGGLRVIKLVTWDSITVYNGLRTKSRQCPIKRCSLKHPTVSKVNVGSRQFIESLICQ